MTEFYGPGDPIPQIPDDLTIPQFLLDVHHHTRPVRPQNLPWFIEEDTGREIGYDEVRTNVHGAANALHDQYKIGWDDVVCIFSPNSVYWPQVVWGIYRLGGIITGANPTYTTDELLYHLEATKPKLLICHPDVYPVAKEAAQQAGLSSDKIILMDPPRDGSVPSSHRTVPQLIAEGIAKPTCYVERRLAPGEGRTKLATLSFSSGTTGRPKAVMVPHYAIIGSVILMAHTFKINENWTTWDKRKFRVGDSTLAVLPFYHAAGFGFVMHFLPFAGMPIVVVPKFDFIGMLKNIQRYRITTLTLVPPMGVLLAKHPATKQYDLSSIRSIVMGAAPVSAELDSQLVAAFPGVDVGQAYGLTETGLGVSTLSILQERATPGCAGILMPGIVARVVKPDGSLAGFNEPGELVVKCPSPAIGYLNNPKATAETFRGEWIWTGDEVVINEKMELFVKDRIKEMIKVRAFQVAPAELEGHLLGHTDVDDVCVIGIPDEYSGELPFAFVVLSASAKERIKKDPGKEEEIRTSIMKHVSDKKAPFKRLAGVEFTSEIPKNPSGKILRRVLRDHAKEMQKKGTLNIRYKSRL